QGATKDAFELLHFIAAKRLRSMKLTVVDATNVQPESRKSLIELARANDVLPVAIVFDVPERVSQDRNKSRPDRDFGPHVVRQQAQQLRRSLRGMQREGLRYVWTLSSVEEVDAATITRQRLWTDRRDERGRLSSSSGRRSSFATASRRSSTDSLATSSSTTASWWSHTVA